LFAKNLFCDLPSKRILLVKHKRAVLISKLKLSFLDKAREMIFAGQTSQADQTKWLNELNQRSFLYWKA